MKTVVGVIRRYLLQMPTEEADLHEKNNRTYFIYGIVATWWLIAVMIGICVGMLIKFPLFGYWLTFFTVLAVVMKLYKAGKFLTLNRRTIGWSGRTRIILLVVLVIAIYLFFFMPLNAHVTSTFVLRPRNLATVTAPANARLVEVLAQEGQWVEKGQTILRFENTDITMRIIEDRSQLDSINVALKQEMLNKKPDGGYLNPDRVAELTGFKNQTERDLKYQEDRLAELAVTSPVSGYVLSPGLNRHIGRGFQKGEGLLQIGDTAVMTAEISVEHQDFGNIALGQPVTLHIKARSDKPVEGVVETKSERNISEISREQSASAGGAIFARRNPLTGQETPINSVYEITVTVPNHEGDLLKGMTGSANIRYGRTTIAHNIWTNLSTWLKNILRL